MASVGGLVCLLMLGITLATTAANQCTKDGFFGVNCDYTCHCAGNKPCDKATGKCPNVCASGWKGEYCQRGNAAKGKPSQQSTTWSGQTAHHGNDGHASTDFTNCANTQYESQPWWKVYLGKDYVIFRILLLNSDGNVRSCKRTFKGDEYRGSVSTTSGKLCKDWLYTKFANKVPSGSSNYCRNPDNGNEPWCYTTNDWGYCNVPHCQQLHYIKLWVDSKEVYYYPGYTSYATYHTIGFQSPPVGRQIKIGQTQQSSLTLCELFMDAFQYRACADKRYGPNCNNRCQCANDTKCDDKTGKCPSGCNDRFTGPYCNIEMPSFSQVGSSTPTSIKFQWKYIRPHDSTYNAGTVTKYLLRYSYKPGFIDSFGVTSPSGTVEANVTGLKPSTRYSFGLRVEYTVASKTAWNEGKPSRNFTTAPCSGYVPTPKITISSNRIDTNVAKPNRASVTIQIAVTGISECFKKIDVYYKKSTAGSFNSVASFTKQQGSQRVQRLIPYADYNIKAVVTSPDGITEESFQTVKTAEDVPPAPGLVKVAASTKGITVKIIPPDPSRGIITRYRLEIAKEATTSNTTVDRGPTEQFHTFAGLTSYATFEIRAKAWTSKGAGDWSNIIKIITEDNIPGPPATIGTKKRLSKSIELVWKPPKYNNGELKTYMVVCTPMFSYDPEVNSKKEENVLKFEPGPSEKQQRITDLKPATQYNCTVAAQTSKGYGSMTSMIVWTLPERAVIPEDLLFDLDLEEKTRTTITVMMKKMPKSLKFGAISKVHVGVDIKKKRQKRSSPLTEEDASRMTDYKTAKSKGYSSYIAAELDANLTGPFIIGDDKTYGGYYNPPLETGKTYDIIFGIVFQAGGVKTVSYRRYGKSIEVGDDGSADPIGLPVGVTIGAILLLIVIIVPTTIICIRRKRRNPDSTTNPDTPHDESIDMESRRKAADLPVYDALNPELTNDEATYDVIPAGHADETDFGTNAQNIEYENTRRQDDEAQGEMYAEADMKSDSEDRHDAPSVDTYENQQEEGDAIYENTDDTVQGGYENPTYSR